MNPARRNRATHNPFRAKAEAARRRADALNRPTAQAEAMADAFPLGPGFGRRGSERRIEASVSRAVAAAEAEQRARYLEAQAAAFDTGEINAQGRHMDRAARERSDKRHEQQQKREQRITAARAICDAQPRHEVSPEDWATASGYLAGSSRALVMAEQAEYIEKYQAKQGNA